MIVLSVLSNCPAVYYEATRGLLWTDHVILDHGQVTWATPELAPTSPNYHTTPHHTNGRTFQLSIDLECIAALHVKVSDHGRHVISSSPVPLKTRRVGQRCTLNLSRAETSSRWFGVVVRRGSASSDVVHVS
ncbi:hypothetical protein TNCV_1454531 [Trichonephila clavipes]|nr:hypothetical protein TNCV_1454531 [Trichonephila clavipes]